MLRRGAARADEISLQIIDPDEDENSRAILENMPGWIGDGAPERDVGVLTVGASTPLRPGRRYCGE